MTTNTTGNPPHEGAEREAWLAIARQLFTPGKRQPCAVCGKYQSVAQAHHVIPLNLQADRGYVIADQTHVWLCPNHHALIHGLFSACRKPLYQDIGKAAAPLILDLGEGELDKLIALYQRAFEGRDDER